MQAVIIGWYGTETIGDRAILDGVFNVLSSFKFSKVYIGSLYSFYTERTLLEEQDSFQESAQFMKIKCFNLHDKSVRKRIIGCSDMLIFGGGPLMEIPEMDIMIQCFEMSKERKIPRIIMGCGIEAIYNERYKILLNRLIKLSSLTILRDQNSFIWLNKICESCRNVKVIGDPAIISIQNFRSNIRHVRGKEYIAINFREFPISGYADNSIWSDNEFAEFIDKVQLRFKGLKIVLVPMSTFLYDDRLYLNKISLRCRSKVEVLNIPLNLKQTYKVFADAYACVGMRHHSVAIQSILNGNNLVLDYTEKNYGKTDGLINFIEGGEFYHNRIIYLQKKTDYDLDKLLNQLYDDPFQYKFRNIHKEYVDVLGEYL